MKFALIIYQPHPFDPKTLSPEEHRIIGAEYRTISSSPGVTAAPALGFANEATTVRVRDGQTLAAKGPYAGEAHAVGGFMVLDADSIEEAIGVAARIPAARLGGGVEVRPCEVYW